MNIKIDPLETQSEKIADENKKLNGRLSFTEKISTALKISKSVVEAKLCKRIGSQLTIHKWKNIFSMMACYFAPFLKLVSKIFLSNALFLTFLHLMFAHCVQASIGILFAPDGEFFFTNVLQICCKMELKL